jgi:hypothetical protein
MLGGRRAQRLSTILQYWLRLAAFWVCGAVVRLECTDGATVISGYAAGAAVASRDAQRSETRSPGHNRIDKGKRVGLR